MAFISLVFASAAIIFLMTLAGIIFLIIGTVLRKRNKPKAGAVFRVIGILSVLPSLLLLILFAVSCIKQALGF